MMPSSHPFVSDLICICGNVSCSLCQSLRILQNLMIGELRIVNQHSTCDYSIAVIVNTFMISLCKIAYSICIVYPYEHHCLVALGLRWCKLIRYISFKGNSSCCFCTGIRLCFCMHEMISENGDCGVHIQCFTFNYFCYFFSGVGE